MLKSDSRTIAGHKYTVTQLPFSKGRDAFARLLKIVGPVIARLLEGGASVKALMDDPRALAGGVYELVERLSADDLEYFCTLFGDCTIVDLGNGKAPVLDKNTQDFHFAGNYDAAAKWLAFAIEVNFSSFFGGAASIGAAMQRQAVAAAG